MKSLRLLSLGLLTAGLSACFGGGGDDPPPPAPVTQVPESAGASAQAYTQFAITLPASETAEPLGLDLIAIAPTSEDESPVSLD